MPFHRQQPAAASKLCAVYEHEGMSLCVCAELQSDNSTVTRHFNACPSHSCISSLPCHPMMWRWLDLELLVGMWLFTGLTLISVSYCFHAQNVLHLVCSVILAVSDLLSLCTVSLSDPPEFSPEQPTLIQVLEDNMAIIPLLVSANPEEVSCVWLHRSKLVKGEPWPCDGSINRVPVELSQQVTTQRCHSGSE